MKESTTIEQDVLKLNTMSWVEFEEALPDLRLAIIPTGSCEQHGPNLALQTDIRLAGELAERVARRLFPHAVLVPGPPWGMSGHHMHFPGTLSLRATTMDAIVSDLVMSLSEHGLTNFLIINSHGGNAAALRVTVSRLLTEEGIRGALVMPMSLVSDLIKERVGSRHWGHAGEVETSVALHLAPDIVKVDSLTAEDWTSPPFDVPLGQPAVYLPVYLEELTANGAYGDARLASAEFGEEVVEAAVDRILEVVDGLLSLAEPPEHVRAKGL